MAAKASRALQGSKRARRTDGQERAQPSVRRYRNYGGTGHNTQTCKKDTEESSKSDVSITYASSLFNSD